MSGDGRMGKAGITARCSTMAWETRNNRRYYYRKRRLGRSVVSEYQGTREAGLLAAEADARRRAKREAARKRIERMKQGDRTTNRLCRQLRTVAASILEGHGYHRHKGQWRRKRNMNRSTKQSKAITSKNARKACENAWSKAISKTATDADNARLIELAKAHPDEFRHCTDMATWAAESMVGPGWDGRPAIREAIMLRFDQVRRDLGYDHSSTAEQLLIDQVAVCYFRLNLAETEHSYAKGTSSERGYREQRLSAIQRRYIRSIESLARVRKLVQSPVVQVNIAADGGQQVVANSPVTAGKSETEHRIDKDVQR